ncbi:UNVERIFIED_CONTAM: hypothetical protein Scaly_2540700 [Sesamum calycinum]|uniref:Uncharacterized protein n=1 Tax=Sesamum calycinum TaxID=2727403 RepID=A0AAW2JDU4_9LAMI
MYIHDIVSDTGLSHAKLVTTPLPQGVKLKTKREVLLPNPELYRRLVGRLLYLCFMRPDISHSVKQLSQFLQHPSDDHWSGALHVLKCLEGKCFGFLENQETNYCFSFYGQAEYRSIGQLADLFTKSLPGAPFAG